MITRASDPTNPASPSSSTYYPPAWQQNNKDPSADAPGVNKLRKLFDNVWPAHQQQHIVVRKGAPADKQLKWLEERLKKLARQALAY
jgi:hypothetical protein